MALWQSLHTTRVFLLRLHILTTHAGAVAPLFEYFCLMSFSFLTWCTSRPLLLSGWSPQSSHSLALILSSIWCLLSVTPRSSPLAPLPLMGLSIFLIGSLK